ncbi:sulfatase [Flammeovirga sp. SubArs3]|uniref:sulfatase n=1 Tax=Flammeovirga sp. SubArs3 TaxID=2995316 RepID=UPI00248B431E|nr:sulfatase [Flammeovirga sp. SubArs3]
MKKIKYLFTLLACLFVHLSWAQNKPNIVLINVDDMGWKDVSYMGSKFYETPNIDDLASQGIIFMNGYAASANCAPSRACLMSGQWTPRHGVYTVGPSNRGKVEDRKLIPTENTWYLSKDFEIIPQVLQKNGYTTCHAGKWHVDDDPTGFGFDYNFGGGKNGHPISYYPPYKNVKSLEEEGDMYLTDLLTKKSIGFIEEAEKPFFLYFSTYAIHTPINPVRSLIPKYRAKEKDGGHKNVNYATMIENLDRNIGLLIESLKEKGVYENTLIIFTSDNGGLHGITDQKPLRAGKGSYYEGGIREPFFFVWPNKLKKPRTSDVQITNMDIYPTILAAAGIKDHQGNLDGDDLLPVLKSKNKKLERTLFWHFPIYLQAYVMKGFVPEHRDPLFRTRPGSAMRKGNWKLHYYFEDKGVELYDLASDLGEQNNIASQHPEVVKELMAELEQWWKETNAPIPTELNPKYQPQSK